MWVAGLPFYIYIASWLACIHVHVHVHVILCTCEYVHVPEVSEPLSPTGQLCPESPPEKAWRAAGLRYGGPWPAGSPGGRQGEVVCTQQLRQRAHM